MDPNTLYELKKALETEHDKLVGELKFIAKPDPTTPGDWDAARPQFQMGSGSHSALSEEADEVEEYEVRLETEHSMESRLLEINKALEKIQQETYGKCLKCKKEIPTERLKANPAAESCIEHS